MTERDYAIRSFKEVTLNAARHTEERMNLYYGKIKELMNNYQDLILENQMVLDELEQECQEKINENMAYALQYMDSYDYRMNLGKLKKEVNNIILIYGLCDMVNRAMTLVKYFTPNFGTEYYDVLYGCFCRHRKMTDMEIMLELGMSRASFYRKKKVALRYLGCVVWAYGAGSEAGCYLSGAHGKTSMYRVDLRRCVAADECERTSGIPL